MSEAEDVCGCLVCAVLCGVCCVAAAEEDKRERERAAAEALQLKNPGVVMVNPVAVPTPYSQLRKEIRMDAIEPKEPIEPASESTKKKPKKSKNGKVHKRNTGSKHRRDPPRH